MARGFEETRVRRDAAGRFAPTGHGEPDLDAAWEARADQLESAGFAAATSMSVPSWSARVSSAAQWWGRHEALGEFGGPDGTYPKMPERGFGEGRRTPVMTYGSGSAELHMPAVAAVKRFAEAAGGVTFDVPVNFVANGWHHAGHVRVTPGPFGQWSVHPLGFPQDVHGVLAEAVSSTLEARAPRRSMPEIGDLAERFRRRRIASGAAVAALESSWLEAAGYDDAAGVMVLTTQDGRAYGYRVSRQVHDELRNAPSPGRLFVQRIKGSAERAPVRQCPRCGRFFSLGEHRCPVQMTERPAADRAGEQARRCVLAGALRPLAPPGHRRGAPGSPTADLGSWTDTPVAQALSRYADHMHVPGAYTHGDNGTGDELTFAGLSRGAAGRVLAAIPASRRGATGGNGTGPSARNALSVAAAMGDLVEADGRARRDGTVSVDSLYLFEGGIADRASADRYARSIGLVAAVPPRIARVNVPWRPGPAWRLSWA